MVPSFFISHGSPTLAIEKNEYTDILSKIGSLHNPKAIVLFTAHWEKRVTTISFKEDKYDTIHDFGGFSEELHNVTYPASGSVEVAAKVERLLNDHNIESDQDGVRGLDHGSWVILKHMYPEVNIPIVQVSVNPDLSPKEQFSIGAALRELANENILVIGSGGISHNLGLIKWGQSYPEKWATEFDEWIIEQVRERKYEQLFNYDKLAPHAQLAVPRAEHIVPLFIALGSGDVKEKPKVMHHSYQYATLSHIIFQF
ncbi:dioxygenase [Lottiidibacillus patelloidae]|uniref:Dioxygenase n=1 Tax=Lottiidibacillus patelloidae TaxID=2670334 RepID=A0A263BQT1_9BACI|nr:class III extradiol ring-cleavage dioxygenase [Lottiidibacillus patelloidae]OZM55938.1 dioxygenase [Lottiidibacillus patelloidae]